VREYGILYSCASEETIPGLVDGPYATLHEAMSEASKVCLAQPGIAHVLTVRTPGQAWRAMGSGLDPTQALRRWR